MTQPRPAPARRRPALSLIAALALTLPAGALAQEAESEEGAGEEQIVVTGSVVDVEVLPTQVTGDASAAGSTYRRVAADSERFVRCAKLPEAADLSTILDHGPKHIAAQKALHRYVVTNIGCFTGAYYPPVESTPFYGECNAQTTGLAEIAICRTTFDRGELFERAVANYGDGRLLTREDTFDKATQDRFWTRAEDRARFRDDRDYQFFAVIGCMVQLNPQEGHALLDAKPGSEAADEAMRRLVGLGSFCVGGAKDIRVDPSQVRAYAAEAMYEWLVATSGSGTLIHSTES